MIVCAAALLAALPPARTAREIARGIEAHYRRARTLEAVFLERYADASKVMRVESGRVYFSRPGRMRWDYDSPQSKMFLVDGRNVWYYVPADHTASRTSLKQSADWRTPLALLTGKVRISRLCAAVRLEGGGQLSDPEARPAEPGNSVLRCTPRVKPGSRAASYFREVLFEVNPRGQLVRILIREPGGVETEFRFGDWKENIPLPEAEFHFSPPVGVAIVNDAALAGEVQ